LLVTGWYAYWLGVPFADTYTYLDPGRNYMAGRGFVSRFNVVYGWSGRLDHPGWAYYNPLYGFLLALLWRVIDDPAWVACLATAVPASLNAALLGVLVRRSMGEVTAILSAAGYLLIPTTWRSLSLLAAEHPAMTLLLLALLLVEYRESRGPRRWFWVGAVFGVAAFVKLTVLLVLPGLLVAVVARVPGDWRTRARRALRPAGGFLAGLAVLVLPYTAACALTVGERYPSYPGMARNWSLASVYGGRFVAASPAVEPEARNLPSPRDRLVIVLDNAQTFIRATAVELSVLVLFIGVGIARAGAAQRLVVLLLLCGASLALGHAASFDWLRLSGETGSAARYALYVAAFWYPVAVFGLVRLLAPAGAQCELTAETRETRAHGRTPLPRGAEEGQGGGREKHDGPASRDGIHRPERAALLKQRCTWLVVALWSACSLPHIAPRLVSFVEIAGRTQPRVTPWRQAMTALATAVGSDELVAVEGGGTLIGAAVFLDRPVVALPQDRLDTPETMRQFVEVFQPRLIIPGRTRSADAVLPDMGYQKAEVAELNRLTVYVRPR
jgi:hypothetical protein